MPPRLGANLPSGQLSSATEKQSKVSAAIALFVVCPVVSEAIEPSLAIIF